MLFCSCEVTASDVVKIFELVISDPSKNTNRFLLAFTVPTLFKLIELLLAFASMTATEIA